METTSLFLKEISQSVFVQNYKNVIANSGTEAKIGQVQHAKLMTKLY